MDQVDIGNEIKHMACCFTFSIRWRLNIAGFDERLCPTHEWLLNMDGNRHVWKRNKVDIASLCWRIDQSECRMILLRIGLPRPKLDKVMNWSLEDYIVGNPGVREKGPKRRRVVEWSYTNKRRTECLLMGILRDKSHGV